MAVTLWSAWAFGAAVLCLQPARLMAQDQPGGRCVFEGVARNRITRLTVAKASVRLIPLDGSQAYAGSSNAAGVFHFEGIAPGDYQVEAQRTGFSEEWVLSDSAGRAVSSLHLAPGEKLSGGNLWLTPEAAVSGRVLGPDGEPLPGARVYVIARQWRRGKRAFVAARDDSTDAAGEYRLTGLDAGSYLVYAERPASGPLAFSIKQAADQPEMHIAGRYHPNAPQLDGAAAIEVGAGEEIRRIDFRLPLAPVVHLTGQGEPGNAAETAWVTLEPQQNGQALPWAGLTAAIEPDGRFTMDGVEPGSYLLSTIHRGPRDRLTSARIPLTVASRDIAAIAAPPVRQFDLKGHVRVEGRSPGEDIAVQIFCEGSEGDDFTAMARRAKPNSDGTFSIANLTPDRYVIRLANLETGKDGGYYLKALRANGALLPGLEIGLEDGPPPDFEVLLSAQVGSAEGSVRRPLEEPNRQSVPEPAGELTVVIVPEKVASGDRRPKTAYLDADNHFRVTDLEPGAYRVFAVTRYDRGLWQNAEFLRQISTRGVPLEVTEKGSAPVEVQVLPAEVVRQVEQTIA